jgi:hypothetical protein
LADIIDAGNQRAENALKVEAVSGQDSAITDKDLRRLAGRWNTLPENLKKAILLMAGIQ